MTGWNSEGFPGGEKVASRSRFLSLAVDMGEVPAQIPDLILAVQELRRTQRGTRARCGDLLIEYGIVDRARVDVILASQRRMRRSDLTREQAIDTARRTSDGDITTHDTWDHDTFREKIAKLEQRFDADMSDNDWELLILEVQNALKQNEPFPDLIAWVENQLRRKMQLARTASPGEMSLKSHERHESLVLRILIWASGLVVITSGLVDRLGLAIVAVLLCAFGVAIQIRRRSSRRT